MYEYENLRRIVYGTPGSEYEGATFIPVCPNCGRFVTADATITFRDGTVSDEPNAECRRCGRVEMPFEGFHEAEPC